MAIQFDPTEPSGLELARQIVFERLRADSAWQQIPHDSNDQSFDSYVEYVGDRASGRARLQSLIREVVWELVVQGVLCPGQTMLPNTSNVSANFPFFHVTDYGQSVLTANAYVPHDPLGFLRQFRVAILAPDPTVEAYLTESLDCFTKGTLVASVVMLGVASERAFLILCDALLNALPSGTEHTTFERILRRNPIKPKMDWVSQKIQSVQESTLPRPFADDVDVTLTAIFNFIRRQRNSLGHPRSSPPSATRQSVFASLVIFPEYYKTLISVIDYLTTHSV